MKSGKHLRKDKKDQIRKCSGAESTPTPKQIIDLIFGLTRSHVAGNMVRPTK
jgi:hypothetical protein